MIRDLEVRHCRILIAVHDQGGVAAAASALGLAQSTVSEGLLSLERVIGVPVTLRRPGREALLTSAAEALLPHARTLVQASEAALAIAVQSGRGLIRLGAVESISSFLLPGPLGAFRSRWPGVEVRIAIGLCDDLRKRVQRGELDAALTIEGADSTRVDAGASRALSPAWLRLVVSPHNPLGPGPRGKEDLRAKTFLLTDSDGAFNQLVRSWLGGSAHSARLESAGSIDGVKRGVQNGEAIGVLPGYAATDELSSGSLVELKTTEPLPAIALLITTPATPSEASPLHDLIEQIGEHCRSNGAVPERPSP